MPSKGGTTQQDVEPLPSDIKSTEVPSEKVKLILEVKYLYGKKKLAEIIFRDLDPILCRELFKIYHQQCRAYSEAIRQEYQSVYSNDDTLEYNAKILLDIFLEVPYFDNDLPPVPLTSENCDEFLARIEATMNRWNEVVYQIKSDDNALWGPETISELRSINAMWGLTCSWRRLRMMKETATTLQFYVPGMITASLCQTLGNKQKLCDSRSLLFEGRKLFEDFRGRNIVSNFDPAIVSRSLKLLNDFRALSIYANTKEHAMMALVPLLPNLSKFDAKKLIYALFSERHNERDDWWRSPGWHDGFSESDMNFGSLWTQNIPCALGECTDTVPLEHVHQSLFGSDMSRLAEWVYGSSGDFDENSLLNRLLGLPLPANIISAMGEYMVENLYQGNINDVDAYKWLNAFEVRPFLDRYCYENPDNAEIVWTYLQQAIENAILAVEGLEADDVDERQLSSFKIVTMDLVESCIRTRAKSLIPLLMRLEDTQEILPELISNVENLAERFEQAPPACIDTKEYFKVRLDRERWE